MSTLEVLTTDQFVLITGSTDGIGKEAAKQLVQKGFQVVLHGRNREKSEATRQEIENTTGKSVAGVVVADLSSQQGVRSLARQVRKGFPHLNVLINNAGVFSQSRRITIDGLEETLAVNYLAPFLLTNLVIDLLKENVPSRVIQVASILHKGAELDFRNFQGERHYNGYDAYSTSKLALVLFTYELAERLRGSGVTVNCLHPGAIHTKLLEMAYRGAGLPVEQGGNVLSYLASDPKFANATGVYFEKSKEGEPDPRSFDRAFRRKVWEYAEQCVGTQQLKAS